MAKANDTTGVFDALVEHSMLETPEEAATVLVKLIDATTREAYGGEFPNVETSRMDNTQTILCVI